MTTVGALAGSRGFAGDRMHRPFFWRQSGHAKFAAFGSNTERTAKPKDDHPGQGPHEYGVKIHRVLKGVAGRNHDKHGAYEDTKSNQCDEGSQFVLHGLPRSRKVVIKRHCTMNQAASGRVFALRNKLYFGRFAVKYAVGDDTIVQERRANDIL